MPYVSVVIPAYNAADFITEAYRSIVDQTIDDWEIIFVNDGSHDDTLAVIRSFAAVDTRIKVVDLAVNSGPACARNAALAIAEGDWVAVLDADDWYHRDRLEALTRAAERTGADIILDNQFVVDPITGRTAFHAFEPHGDDVTTLEFSDFLRNSQSNTFFDFGYLQPIIRRRWLTANNIKYSERLRLGEDLMLLFECYVRHPDVILLSRPYYYYNFPFSQKSRTNSPTTRTEVDRERLLAEIEQFLEKHRAKLSRLERRLVASVCESLREDIMAAALRAHLKNVNVVGIICILRHPIRLLRSIYFAKKRSFLYKRRLRTVARTESRLDAGRGD